MDPETYRVEVGGHRLHAVVTGAGPSTVVIEPGWGDTARSWQPVVEALAAEATVVTYDRAGYGASSPALDRRTPGDVARDLHGVLTALQVEQPVIVVGHSMGGGYVRAYAARHTANVAGMVLVDSSYEGQGPMLAPHLSRRERLAQWTAPVRLALARGATPEGADRRTLVRELQAWARTTRRDRPRPMVLGDRPLTVLTRTPGRILNNDLIAAAPEGPTPALWQCWHGFHQELARLSRNSRHLIAPHSGHFIHRDEPAFVCAAIRDTINGTHSAQGV